MEPRGEALQGAHQRDRGPDLCPRQLLQALHLRLRNRMVKTTSTSLTSPGVLRHIALLA